MSQFFTKFNEQQLTLDREANLKELRKALDEKYKRDAQEITKFLLKETSYFFKKNKMRKTELEQPHVLHFFSGDLKIEVNTPFLPSFPLKNSVDIYNPTSELILDIPLSIKLNILNKQLDYNIDVTNIYPAIDAVEDTNLSDTHNKINFAQKRMKQNIEIEKLKYCPYGYAIGKHQLFSSEISDLNIALELVFDNAYNDQCK